MLLGVNTPHERLEVTEEHLDELELLADTAGSDSLGRFIQKLDHPHPRTYLGKGKLEEVQKFVEQHDADLVITDDELSPSQLRNMEQALEVKILDRNNLILDIFASRAQTSQAKAQVELAQLEYLLPRLTNMWTHLSRQKGGIGMKGPGEKEIETDRRIIRNNIKLLKTRLETIDKQNTTRRKRRGEKIRVALAGYTNAGKSTLMNVLSKADVQAENRLFATLDTTVREGVQNGVPFLLSDTVGFIRKLPHSLIESFKSTLDEVREADIILHVVDLSHPQWQEQVDTVRETLAELDAADKATLMVFNKIDLLQGDEEREEKLQDLRKTWMGKENEQAVFISAEKQTNIQELKEKLLEMVVAKYEEIYPYRPLNIYSNGS